jgi:hypothetical protein
MAAISMLVVLFDPRWPNVRRRFVAIPVGSGVDTGQLLERLATFADDDGPMFTLFEATSSGVDGEAGAS